VVQDAPARAQPAKVVVWCWEGCSLLRQLVNMYMFERSRRDMRLHLENFVGLAVVLTPLNFVDTRPDQVQIGGAGGEAVWVDEATVSLLNCAQRVAKDTHALNCSATFERQTT
jgi:hypothetical protein